MADEVMVMMMIKNISVVAIASLLLMWLYLANDKPNETTDVQIKSGKTGVQAVDYGTTDTAGEPFVKKRKATNSNDKVLVKPASGNNSSKLPVNMEPKSNTDNAHNTGTAHTAFRFISDLRQRGQGITGLHRFLEADAERHGNDPGFTNTILAALREGEEKGIIEPETLRDLESIRCTEALCELIFGGASSNRSMGIKRELYRALKARNVELELISGGPHPEMTDKAYEFLVRPGFTERVISLRQEWQGVN